LTFPEANFLYSLFVTGYNYCSITSIDAQHYIHTYSITKSPSAIAEDADESATTSLADSFTENLCFWPENRFFVRRTFFVPQKTFNSDNISKILKKSQKNA
jgi:hypothetical protein